MQTARSGKLHCGENLKGGEGREGEEISSVDLCHYCEFMGILQEQLNEQCK